MKQKIVRIPQGLTGRTEEYANGDNGTVACGDCKILLKRCEAFLHEQKVYLCNDCANEEDEILKPISFKDLQTRDFSAFTTIDDLAKDLFIDASINGCGCDEKDFYKGEKCFPCWCLENWEHVTYQQKRDIITDYEFEIIENTDLEGKVQCKDVKICIGGKEFLIDIHVNNEGNLELIGLPNVYYEFFGHELVLQLAEEQ